MPNVTVYLPQETFDWLHEQPEKSRLVRELLEGRRKRQNGRTPTASAPRGKTPSTPLSARQRAD